MGLCHLLKKKKANKCECLVHPPRAGPVASLCPCGSVPGPALPPRACFALLADVGAGLSDAFSSVCVERV